MIHGRSVSLTTMVLVASATLGCTSAGEDTGHGRQQESMVVRLHEPGADAHAGATHEVVVHVDGDEHVFAAPGGAVTRRVVIGGDGPGDEDRVLMLRARAQDRGDGTVEVEVRPAPVPPMRRRLALPGAEPMVLAQRLDGAVPPRLGVSVEETPDGLRVTEVEEGSLAATAGLQAGDVLLRVGERRIHAPDDVARALRRQRPGDAVPVVVIRAGEGLVERSVTLPEPRRPGFLGVMLAAEAPEADAPAVADDDVAPPPAGQGVLVTDVVDQSAAWFAGLRGGDRLLAVDGEAVDAAETLTERIGARDAGTTVTLRWLRDGAEHEATVRLGARRPAPAPLLSWMRDADGDEAFPGLRGFRFEGDGRPWPEGLRGLEWFEHHPDLEALHEELRELHLELDDEHHALILGEDLPEGLDLEGATEVHIDVEDDRMVVTRDGVTTHYHREDGRWVPDDETEGPRPR